jgi:hypothetical protein
MCRGDRVRALSRHGKDWSDQVQARGGSRGGFLFAFDLIERDGRDMRFLIWQRPADDFGEAPEHRMAFGFSEHLDGTEGATAFRHACAMGLQENRGEAARGALSIRPVRRLGEDQKSGRASGNASD